VCKIPSRKKENQIGTGFLLCSGLQADDESKDILLQLTIWKKKKKKKKKEPSRK
jgi:hypothetical protein